MQGTSYIMYTSTHLTLLTSSAFPFFPHLRFTACLLFESALFLGAGISLTLFLFNGLSAVCGCPLTSFFSRSPPTCSGNNGCQPPETNAACKQRVQLDREGASAFLLSSLCMGAWLHLAGRVSAVLKVYIFIYSVSFMNHRHFIYRFHLCSFTKLDIWYCRWMTTFAAALSTNPTGQTPNPAWPASKTLLLPDPDLSGLKTEEEEQPVDKRCTSDARFSNQKIFIHGKYSLYGK